jgi:hypothetical protein
MTQDDASFLLLPSHHLLSFLSGEIRVGVTRHLASLVTARSDGCGMLARQQLLAAAEPEVHRIGRMVPDRPVDQPQRLSFGALRVADR